MTNYMNLGVNDGSKSQGRIEWECILDEKLMALEEDIHCKNCPCENEVTYTSGGETHCSCMESILAWLVKDVR